MTIMLNNPALIQITHSEGNLQLLDIFPIYRQEGEFLSLPAPAAYMRAIPMKKAKMQRNALIATWKRSNWRERRTLAFWANCISMAARCTNGNTKAASSPNRKCCKLSSCYKATSPFSCPAIMSTPHLLLPTTISTCANISSSWPAQAGAWSLSMAASRPRSN
jgi:hypothetical protein